jgi:hypothetical protein
MKNYVYTEAGIVFGKPAFVAEVIIPLAAVIFVAIQYTSFAIDQNRLQIIMHQIVAPAVEFYTGGGWPVFEMKKGGI